MADLNVLFIYIGGGVKQAVYLSREDLELWKRCWESTANFISSDGRVGLNPSNISHWHVGDGHTEFFTKPFPVTGEAAAAYESVGFKADKRVVKSEPATTSPATHHSTSSYLIGTDNKEILPLITPKYVDGIRNDYPEELEKEGDTLHHVECKCGAEYYFRRDRLQKISGCKNCNNPVLLDYSKGTHLSPLGWAYTVTNKYYVDRKKWLHRGNQ
ncbi:hypothetical protein OIN60_21830 [Paenibacillus sp. P96]|uniref:Phage protein n=1 Tax=Paenibacillus zeirhizosphaerae TaxID=2987519 RepID=A0ABT9FXA1_9BACL|nr:hypothetical protein [Paenibacillus sp. P96]MDP4099361.1 hypothetical protein [Paenibacillus sp. P96]